MLSTKAACMGETAATCSQASLADGGMYEARLLPWPCIPPAISICADPIGTVLGTVLGACESTRNGSSLTTCGSAEPILRTVPCTKAASVRCIGAAAAYKTLASCAMFYAQASRLRLVGQPTIEHDLPPCMMHSWPCIWRWFQTLSSESVGVVVEAREKCQDTV